MNKEQSALSEATARFTLTAACGMSVFSAGASIYLGLRNLQWQAAVFLLFAVLGCIITWAAYKQYIQLRQKRWQSELTANENELNQLLNHARIDRIVEHITGPLNAEAADTDTPGEQSIAKP